MKVLTVYLLRAQIGPFFFAFLALTGVVLINTLAREMAGLAGKGLSPQVFIEFFVLSLPANIALTLPMSVLVAVLYSFSQFAAENEITALKASGIDLRRMVLPLLIAAGLIAAGMVWFNDRVLPASNYRWRMLMMDVAQTSPLLALNEQVINPIRNPAGSTDYYLQATRIDPATSQMRDVKIYDVSNPDVSRTIYADSAMMAMNETRSDLILTLFDGDVREVDLARAESFQKTSFKRQLLRIAGISQRMVRNTEEIFRTDRDRTISMMQGQIDTLRMEIAKIDSATAAMAADTVPSLLKGDRAAVDESQRQSLLSQIREFKVEIHKKYAIAVATLVFVLIGVPLALRFPRGGIGMVIAASLLIFSIYYVGLIGGETLANRGIMPPELAMWQTNIIFGTLGIVGLWRAGRERSTGRGSGWGDFPTWLRWPRFRSSEPATDR